jgi:hypothetical protein
MAQPQHTTINVTSTPAVGVGVGVATVSTANRTPTENPIRAQNKKAPGGLNFSNFKEEFTSHEHRDPIIIKLNNGDAHYGDNSWLADFCFYTRNNHPLLSILPFCGAHPLHPYSKCERLNIAFVTWTLAFLLSALFERFIYDEDTRYYTSIIVGGIILTLYDIFLTSIAQCSCVQSDKVMKGVRKTAEGIGMMMMVVCCCHGLCLAVFAILVLAFFFSKDVLLDLAASSPSSSNISMGVWVKPHADTFTQNFFAAKFSDLFLMSPMLMLLIFSYKRRSEMAKS